MFLENIHAFACVHNATSEQGCTCMRLYMCDDRETDRQRQTETERDRESQTETDKDRQRLTQTD